MPYQKGEGKSVVIALARQRPGQHAPGAAQLVKDTARNIVDMVERHQRHRVPRQRRRSAHQQRVCAYASANDGKTPEMPFPEAGAMSQGHIGYQLSQAI